MLQRMNELATQASNGTNSTTDRSAIQDEISQLTTEIDRVAETTKFNETYLLKGEDGSKTVDLQAHDAGLKGSLVNNGDGTATFKMDALKAGDKVTIGGKEYTIGNTTEEDVKNFLKKAGVDDKSGSADVSMQQLLPINIIQLLQQILHKIKKDMRQDGMLLHQMQLMEQLLMPLPMKNLQRKTENSQ